VAHRDVWARTLMIISDDEHGGFYDHVVPPIAEVRSQALINDDGQGPAAPFKAPMMIPYALRVPAFVVSPWVGAGFDGSLTLDHCSILKTILARFCGRSRPFLSVARPTCTTSPPCRGPGSGERWDGGDRGMLA
jgi:phospholipase C